MGVETVSPAHLILVVDADPRFLDDARMLLTGQRVLTARDLDEAGEIVPGGRVDLVVLGPTLGTEEALRRASALREAAPDAPMVAAVNIVTDRMLLAAGRSGVSAVVSTPLTLRSVTDLLSHARPTRQAPPATPLAAAASMEPVVVVEFEARSGLAAPAQFVTVSEPRNEIAAPAGTARMPAPAAPTIPAPPAHAVSSPAGRAAEPETVFAPDPEWEQARPALRTTGVSSPPPIPAPPPDRAPAAAAPASPQETAFPDTPAAVPPQVIAVPRPNAEAAPEPPAFPPPVATPPPPPSAPLRASGAHGILDTVLPPSPPDADPTRGDELLVIHPEGTPGAPPPYAPPTREPGSSRIRGAGRVVAVMAGKGGSGKTVTATNLAVALTLQRGTDRIAIVDTDLQFGDVALLLQMDPTRTIVDAAGRADDVTDAKLDSMLLRHESGLRVLPAPVLPTTQVEVPAKAVARLIERLRGLYEVIVVDTPPIFDDHLVTILEEADDVLVVVDMDLPSVKNAKIALDALRGSGFPMGRLRLVVNRVNAKARLDLVELERSLGLRVAGSIPSDRLVPQSVNEGIPVVALSPRSRVARAFHVLAGLVTTADD